MEETIQIACLHQPILKDSLLCWPTIRILVDYFQIPDGPYNEMLVVGMYTGYFLDEMFDLWSGCNKGSHTIVNDQCKIMHNMFVFLQFWMFKKFRNGRIRDGHVNDLICVTRMNQILPICSLAASINLFYFISGY